MTDRIRHVTVILDQDYRDDDAESILNAIRMVKGVATVEAGDPVTATDHINRQIARQEILGEVIELVRKK